jgi:hypothetical protein
MKSITRTIEKYEITGKAVKFVEGVLESRSLERLITSEKVDELKAQKMFTPQLLEGEQAYIISIKIEEKKYEVPTDEFIKLAEKLDSERAEEMKKEVKTAEEI